MRQTIGIALAVFVCVITWAAPAGAKRQPAGAERGRGAPASDGVGVRAGAEPLAQELDQFMKQVLEKRDENWKKLQQYILDEREKVEVRGPGGLAVWGQKREYQWFIRDGYFVRSPISADGVAISEADRRKAEDNFLKRAKARDERAKSGAKPGDKTIEPIDSGGGSISLGGGGVEVLLQQSRQPQFIDTAYFMRFKFDSGRYALVGKEKFGDVDVLKVEYYPTRLFSDEPGSDRERRTQERRSERDAGLEKTMDHLMNKNSKVVLWIEPKAHQIVKYVFDNVQLDFLPVSWLVRMEELRATMTMSQPFKDVWLPKDVEMYFSAMFAIGMVDFTFNLDYFGYREASTSGRIKGRGGF